MNSPPHWKEWDINLAVEIILGADVVFKAKLKSTNSDNDPWFMGKSISGCTMGPSADVGDTVSAPSPSSSANNHVMSDLLEFPLQNEVVLASSTNAGNSIDVSPFVPTTGRTAVYSKCVGAGSMIIKLGDVIESSHGCREGSDDAAHRDELR